MSTRTAAPYDLLRRASVSVLGLVLLVLSLANVVLSDADVWLRLVESGLPVGLALIFLAFGVVLWEHGESPESTVIIAAWAVAGGVVTGALAVWLLAVVTFQSAPIHDATFVVASASTVGSTFGGAAGYYHARLQQTTSDLRQQNVRLDEFASIVSHDLRNPLNVAMGGLQLAAETGDPEDFERVEQAHARMDQMISELLNLSKKGKDVTDLRKVALAGLARKAESTVGPELTLVVETDQRVHADPERLSALLENLFRNAADHGGSDPTVTVGDLADSPGFYVEDDGPGIPREKRDKIFEHGYTTDSDGTGIGLVIVSRIADAHGWEVNVTSGSAGGARFEFRV